MARTKALKRKAPSEPQAADLRFAPDFDPDAAAKDWHDEQCRFDPTRKAALDLLRSVLLRCPTDAILTVAQAFIQSDAVGRTHLARQLSWVVAGKVDRNGT